MADLKTEKLKEEVSQLLKIFNDSQCIKDSHQFNIEKVKECYFSMIDFIIENKEEAAALKEYMTSTDFFKAPASTKFHGDFESGLCVHSLMVAVQALRYAEPMLSNFLTSPVGNLPLNSFSYTAEDVFISAVCHDFCKTGCYKIEFHNVKDFTGNWTKKPVYRVKPELRNLGHGNESVLVMIKTMPSIINRRNVIEAVSRHMGFSDLSEMESMNYSNFLQNPLVLLLQLADQSAASWWNC